MVLKSTVLGVVLAQLACTVYAAPTLGVPVPTGIPNRNNRQAVVETEHITSIELEKGDNIDELEPAEEIQTRMPYNRDAPRGLSDRRKLKAVSTPPRRGSTSNNAVNKVRGNLLSAIMPTSVEVDRNANNQAQGSRMLSHNGFPRRSTGYPGPSQQLDSGPRTLSGVETKVRPKGSIEIKIPLPDDDTQEREVFNKRGPEFGTAISPIFARHKLDLNDPFEDTGSRISLVDQLPSKISLLDQLPSKFNIAGSKSSLPEAPPDPMQDSVEQVEEHAFHPIQLPTEYSKYSCQRTLNLNYLYAEVLFGETRRRMRHWHDFARSGEHSPASIILKLSDVLELIPNLNDYLNYLTKCYYTPVDDPHAYDIDEIRVPHQYLTVGEDDRQPLSGKAANPKITAGDRDDSNTERHMYLRMPDSQEYPSFPEYLSHLSETVTEMLMWLGEDVHLPRNSFVLEVQRYVNRYEQPHWEQLWWRSLRHNLQTSKASREAASAELFELMSEDTKKDVDQELFRLQITYSITHRVYMLCKQRLIFFHWMVERLGLEKEGGIPEYDNPILHEGKKSYCPTALGKMCKYFSSLVWKPKDGTDEKKKKKVEEIQITDALAPQRKNAESRRRPEAPPVQTNPNASSSEAGDRRKPPPQPSISEEVVDEEYAPLRPADLIQRPAAPEPQSAEAVGSERDADSPAETQIRSPVRFVQPKFAKISPHSKS